MIQLLLRNGMQGHERKLSLSNRQPSSMATQEIYAAGQRCSHLLLAVETSEDVQRVLPSKRFLG
jgi:hypothetical protein